MQRTLIAFLFLLMVVVGGFTWWLLGSDTTAPSPNLTPTVVTPGGDLQRATALPSATQPVAEEPQRSAVAGVVDDVLDDPEIRAGLCGFKGRVVDARKAPVADCGVRMYRGAMDTMLPKNSDVFALDDDYVPEVVAGEVRTGSDGTWAITGVWPRAFYLLLAGLGTDAPTHQVITQYPSPGEVVDLGDIVLQDAGVITGTVLDENGDPIAGALVRAADVPGTLAAFYPIERLDPAGAVLVREPNSPIKVVDFPKWVKTLFDKLPIPSTTTGADGAFRLIGVTPGSNMLATTARDCLADVKPSVQVRPAQVKDVGKIKLKQGEELLGKVLDSAGKPIANAEVLAGSTLTMGPFDFAQRLPKTDAEGRFRGQGFSAGKVSVAARRGKGHEWLLAAPQSVLGEVVVTLPAAFGVDVSVTLADGKPAKAPRFQLLPGKADNGAANFALLGLVRPLDLRERKRDVAEGQWRIENLNPGKYTLIADAPGHATSFAEFDLVDTDTRITLALTLPTLFTVRAVGSDDKPIRNAMVYAEATGTRLIEMPIACGRTDAEGTKLITALKAEMLRVSVEHPKWGVVHGEVKVSEEVVLRFQQPGSLQGVVTENGKPPEAGKYTIAITRRRTGDEPRGPMETTPMLVTPGLDGAFTVKVLQPGSYAVSAVKALDALRSPGGIVGMMQDMYMMRNLPEETVQVSSGQAAQVRLETGEKPIEGPTARLSGSITVDGKVGAGFAVMVYAADGNRQFSARADESGRFDFGIVPAGKLSASMMGNGEGGLFSGPGNNLWSSPLELKEGETRDLTIEVTTSSLRGVCLLPDGSPAANVFVQGRGKPKGSEHENIWLHASTNTNGEFHFDQVAEGTWNLTARLGGEESARGELTAVEAVGGVPSTGLRIQLAVMMKVTGRVDLAAFGATKPRWCWIEFQPAADVAASKRGTQYCGIDMEKGAFECDELSVGQWNVKLHVEFPQGANRESAQYSCDSLNVPASGLADVLLRPGAVIPK